MVNELKFNSLVVDQEFHAKIRSQFGESILLIDAAWWLAEMNRLCVNQAAKNPSIWVGDVLAVACQTGSSVESQLESLAKELHLCFRSFNDTSEKEMYQWILDQILVHARNASVDAAGARRAAAILRQDLDMQQQAFLSLESAAQELGMPQLTHALDLPLAQGRLVFSGQEGSSLPMPICINSEGNLKQRLPISARGIASIELCCERIVECSNNGMLTVSITDLTGNSLATSAGIPISEIVAGWNHLYFPEGINCTDRDAVLNISLTGTGAVAFYLAPCTPLMRFHPYQVKGISLTEAPLALKVRRGLAGVRNSQATPRITGKGIVHRRSGEMPRARLYFSEYKKPDYDLVQYWEKEDSFLVHPPVCGVSIGIIENFDAKELISMTAIVHNAHREGPYLSFAIGIVPAGKLSHVPDVLGSWLTLAPLAWGEVHASLPAATSGKFDIVLATMVTNGEGNHMAWGLFRGFLLHIEQA